jgi:flagellin
MSSTTGVVAQAQATTYDVAGAFGNVDIDGGADSLKINGQNVVVNLNGATVAASKQQFVDAVNAQVSGVVASFNSTSGDVTLTAGDGRNISLAASGTAAGTVGDEIFNFSTTAVATETVVARGNVKLQAGGAITTYLSDATKEAEINGEGASAANSVTLINLDISDVDGASEALLVADALLDKISAGRGDLGALQNRLTSTVANLGVVSDKVSEARSRILDADFAAETAALTKGQILQQAGIAILAQANSAPQQVLSLLPR